MITLTIAMKQVIIIINLDLSS